MNESELIRVQARAIRAREILHDELTQEAFAVIRSNLLGKFEHSRAEDVDDREKIWHLLHLMNEFKRYFEAAITDGKIAEAELTKMQKLRKKLGV